MDAIVNEAYKWIVTLSPFSIYSVFFLLAYLENLIPPIPGDVLVAFGGYLAAEQVVGFTYLLLLTTFASVVGFMTMYSIGNYWGYKIDEHRENSWLMKIIDIDYFERGKRWMADWGQWVIVANRFLAGTRTVIALTAGIYKTRVKSTILSSTVSSLVWNFILLGFGWVVHENWYVIGRYLGIYGRVILAGLLLLVVARLTYLYLQRRNVDKL